MSMPFVTTIVEMIARGRMSIDEACDILGDAIAPEIGTGSPASVLGNIRAYFNHVLEDVRSACTPPHDAEASIYEVFRLTAARDYRRFC